MKLCVVATHPIQYQVPLFRMLHSKPEVEVEALFLSDHSVRGGKDPGFGQSVKWDVPMLEGYDHRFLENSGPGVEKEGFLAYRFIGFVKVFREIRPDAVLIPGHGVLVYWQALFAAYRLGIPVLVRPESLDGAQPKRKPWKTWVRKILLKQFYGRVSVFCSTGFYARRDAEAYGFSPEEIVDSPYCIDTELFEKHLAVFQSQREDIRKELGIKEGDMGIVFMGKMIDWKNPSLILDAIEVMSEDDRSRMFPILVGSGQDFEKVQARCQKVMRKGRYSCPGFVNQSELCRYYVAGDVFVLPSKRGHESWGLVVNEAMTCGLPAIVSDGVGCRKDLVEQSGTGAVFLDGDKDGLAEQILQLENGCKSPEMKQKVQQRLKEYSSLASVAGILQALEKVSGK